MHQATILNHLQLIEVTGEDAQEFLSNQFTSDVNALLDGKFQLSGWCNPKGRVLFTPILYRSGNSYFCLLPKDMAQQFCQRLTMFVLRSKVHIDSIDSHQAVAVSISESSKLEELSSATANDNEWVMLQSPWHSDDGSISHILVGPKDSGLLADLNWLSQGDVAQWHCSRL